MLLYILDIKNVSSSHEVIPNETPKIIKAKLQGKTGVDVDLSKYDLVYRIGDEEPVENVKVVHERKLYLIPKEIEQEEMKKELEKLRNELTIKEDELARESKKVLEAKEKELELYKENNSLWKNLRTLEEKLKDMEGYIKELEQDLKLANDKKSEIEKTGQEELDQCGLNDEQIAELKQEIDTERNRLVTVFSDKRTKEYNESKDRWEEIIKGPEWWNNGSCCTGNQSIIVCVGAKDKDNATKGCFIDLKKKTINPLPPLPVPTRGAGIAVQPNQVFIIGGHQYIDNRWCYTSDCYLLDNIYDNKGWIKLPDLPFKCDRPSVLVNNDCIYVFGGYRGGLLKSMYSFNIATQVWQPLPDLPESTNAADGNGFIKDSNIIIMSKTLYISYSIKENNYQTQKHNINVDRIHPVLYKGRIICSVGYQGKRLLYHYDSVGNVATKMTDEAASVYRFYSLYY